MIIAMIVVLRTAPDRKLVTIKMSLVWNTEVRILTEKEIIRAPDMLGF